MLTRALAADTMLALHLLAQLAQHPGAWLLDAAASFSELQELLAALVATVAALPFDKAAVAALSCAPLDAAERAQAYAEGDGALAPEAEPLLHLQAGWFWVAAVCQSGRCAGAR